ncbi:hypothetical protein AYI70_g10334 [Smittium culicis]|uniref:Uncharacterized protein n=1 Tax=Smittium culicis TaxID=133412 RepID=A0A1R1X768_9FUNG|nr:hypothetical protein AYI70_g10334 [Smittium culicis]
MEPQGYGYGAPNRQQGPPPMGNPHSPNQNRPPQGPPNSQQAAFQWVMATDGSIPPNAVQGGVEKDGTPLFIARSFYKGGLHPGKAGPHLEGGGFLIGYGGKEVKINEYFVLCGDASRLRWVEQHGILDISNFRPIEAGHEETGEPLFVAKTLYEGSQQIGKCGQHLKQGMSFSYGKKERNSSNYMVLAYV